MSDDSMKKYLEIMNEDIIDESIIDDILDSMINEENDINPQIINDLKESVEQLENYFESNPNEDYIDGLYEGLKISVNIINVIIDRYSKS